MSMIKRGTHDTAVIVSSSVYTCESCGHMEVVQDDEDGPQECSKCSSSMKRISSHGATQEEI